jgi:hypothetical protein
VRLGSAVVRAHATVLVHEDGFEYDGQVLSLPNLSGVGPADFLLRYHTAVRCLVTVVYDA